MRSIPAVLVLAALFSAPASGADATPKGGAPAKPDATLDNSKQAPAAEPEKKEEKGKAEAPPPPPDKVDAKTFDLALQDYFGGNPKSAAPKLFAFIETVSSTDENYAWAQFFLAKSLIDLGLKHAGAVYLAKIARERTNPAVLPRALQELRSFEDIPHDEVMIDENVFGVLDLGFVPDEIAAFAHYQQGLFDLRLGNERWATMHFAKLPESSAEASRAKFATLVMRLKQQKEATQDMIEDFLTLSKDEKLTREARNEAILAVARLHYERKEYNDALEAYEQVALPPLDPGRASLYLEEAWTRYQLGQIHAAMGLLTTLDAPSFRDEFLPDKYLLRAFVYRDLCQYLPAKRAAKELTRRFADSLEAIREREDLTQDLRLRRAASSHGATKRASRFLETLDLEGERLGRFAGSFGDRLIAHLTKLYDLSHAEASRVHDQRLKEAVREEADRLLKGAEQVRLMEYEVGLKLYERIKKGAKLVAVEDDAKLTPTQIAFHFDGEYWNDELRDYRFNLKSRCIEETAQ
jgi:hypothetical protein